MNAPVRISTLGTSIDPRLAFLERAAARLLLVKAGVMELDEAIDGLAPAFWWLLDGWNFDETVEQMAAANKSRFRNRPRHRRTPKVVVDAVMYCMRARGLAALKEPANVRRLADCNAAAKAEIKRQIKEISA